MQKPSGTRDKYGTECMLDLLCEEGSLDEVGRDDLRCYLDLACYHLGVVKRDRHFWDDLSDQDQGRLPLEMERSPHTEGITCIQFLTTSNITIHVLPRLSQVFINVFTCGEVRQIDWLYFMKHTLETFDSVDMNFHYRDRGWGRE